MKISLIITTKNEEDLIERLIDSILSQSRLPNEVVIVDSKSEDRTVEIIKKKFKDSSVPLKLIETECNIAKGRNIAIKETKNKYVAVTDGGCQLGKDWLLELEKELLKSGKKVIFGASIAKGQSIIGKCFSLLHKAKTNGRGLTATEFSSRSLLIAKDAWEHVGGYPEWLTLAGEDTHFFIALSNRFDYSYARKAVCYWYHGNENLRQIFKMHFRNSIGGGESSMWSLRYSILISIYLFLGILGLLSIVNLLFFPIFLVLILLFTSRFSYSACMETRNLKPLFYMSAICFIRDLGMISGYIQGYSIKHNVDLSETLRFVFYLFSLIIFNLLTFFTDSIFTKFFIVIFLTIFPGQLMLKALRIRSTNYIETVSIASGLSIFNLYLLSLLTNWLTPLISNVPAFSRSVLSVFISISYLVLLLLAFLFGRKKDNPLPTFSFSQLDIFIFLSSLILPLLSILGSSSLNNGGSNIFTLLALLGVGVYVLVVSILRKRLSESIFPALLYIFSLTFMLAISLRGWNISGHDILAEYRVFKLTEVNSTWDISLFRDAYNALLSITTLPTIFNSFLGLNEYIFKLVFQAIFSIAPVALYFLTKKISKPFVAFLSVVFFMSQSPFLRDFSYLVRQEIALLFYVLSLLVLFSDIPKRRKAFLFIVFSMGVTLSHYTTAYFAVAINILAYIFEKIWVAISKMIHKKGEEHHFNYSLPLVIVPLVFTIFWYGIFTKTSDNLSTFLDETTKGINQILTFKNSKGKNSIFDQFELYNEFGSTEELVTSYRKTEQKKLGADKYLKPYNPELYSTYTPYAETSILLPQKMSPAISRFIYGIGEVIKKSMKIFMLIGIGYFLVRLVKRNETTGDFSILAACNLLLLFISIIIPFLSINYDLMRAYQQMLVVLSLPTVVGCIVVLNRLIKKAQYLITASIFALYYLFISPFVPQVIGEGYAHLQLNNFGLYYNIYYVHDTELASIKWLSEYGDENTRVNTDWYSGKKIVTFSKRPIWMNDTVLPEGISRNEYVYSNFVNTEQGLAYSFYKGELQYRYPTSFLESNKDVIYNNGSTKIYK